MSHSRKHVTSEALESFPVPEGDQKIVRVTGIRGSNIVEVEYPDGGRILCLLPAKFKKRIWIKRGNFLIIEPFAELFKHTRTSEAINTKLKGRIVHILLKDQVKYLQKMDDVWPVKFLDTKEETINHDESNNADVPEDSGDEDEKELDPYLVNVNHRVVDDSSESESEEGSSSSEEP